MGVSRKIGIKPGRAYLEAANPKDIRELLSSGLDHFEFEAPYAIAILVCLIVGALIGAGTSKAFLFDKRGT